MQPRLDASEQYRRESRLARLNAVEGDLISHRIAHGREQLCSADLTEQQPEPRVRVEHARLNGKDHAGDGESPQVLQPHRTRERAVGIMVDEPALRGEEGLIVADVQAAAGPRDQPFTADQRSTAVRGGSGRKGESTALDAPEPRVLELPRVLRRSGPGEQDGEDSSHRQSTEESHNRKPREWRTEPTTDSGGQLIFRTKTAPQESRPHRPGRMFHARIEHADSAPIARYVSLPHDLPTTRCTAVLLAS